MRFTILGEDGSISFSGPGHALKALTAACSEGISSYRRLLDRLGQFDQSLSTSIINDLAVFDELVVQGSPSTIDAWLENDPPAGRSVFRILDDRLRRRSLLPGRLGIVLFNLPEKRIVQIENSYGALQRSDRGRIRLQGKPVNRYYDYELPDEWAIVP